MTKVFFNCVFVSDFFKGLLCRLLFKQMFQPFYDVSEKGFFKRFIAKNDGSRIAFVAGISKSNFF